MPDRRRTRSAETSRRGFLWELAAANGTILAGGPGLWAAQPDPRIKQILAKTITVDMHNHGGIGSNTPPQTNPTDNALNGTPKNSRKTDRLGQDANIVEAMQRAGDNAICLT
jgi:hypothetical protein